MTGFRTASGRPAGAALEAVARATPAAIAATNLALGFTLQQSIVDTLSTPGAGREYPRGQDRVHVASAPGDPPAVDTGALRGSAFTEAQPEGAVHVGVQAEYAAALEDGTEDMAPRPFMRPALEQVNATLQREVSVVLKREVRRGRR